MHLDTKIKSINRHHIGIEKYKNKVFHDKHNPKQIIHLTPNLQHSVKEILENELGMWNRQRKGIREGETFGR